MSSGYSVQKLSETLSKISPFSSLTSQQRVSVLEVSKLRQYKAGMDLCREGEASRELFILLSGSVAVIHNGHIIAKPQPVTCIGEMGVFTGEPRSATVRAESQTLTIVMTKEVLDNIINTQYRIGITLLQDIGHTLSMRQRESNKLLAKYRSLVQQLEAEKQDLERMIMEKRSSTGGQKTPAVQQPPVQDEPAAKQSALEK
ncbi:MAG: cyclic nucleotide-binding domain-containing protein, partial [Spirochaetia bacterium]